MSSFVRRIRIALDVSDPADRAKDVISAKLPAAWRGTSCQVEIALRNGKAKTSPLADVSSLESISLDVSPWSDKGGARWIQKVANTGDINAALTLEEWNSGDQTKAHVIFVLGDDETNIGTEGVDEKFWMVVHGLGPERQTFGATQLNIVEDGVPEGAVPSRGGNLVPAGLEYGLGGTVDVELIQDKVYAWKPGAHDTSISNGTDTLTEEGLILNLTGTLTLAGTIGATVTAMVTLANYFTSSEADGRFLKADGSNVLTAPLLMRGSDDNIYSLAIMVDDEGNPFTKILPVL